MKKILRKALEIGQPHCSDVIESRRIWVTVLMLWICVVISGVFLLIYFFKNLWVYSLTALSPLLLFLGLLWLLSLGYKIVPFLMIQVANGSIFLGIQMVQGDIPLLFNCIATASASFILLDFRRIGLVLLSCGSSVFWGLIGYIFPDILTLAPHNLTPETISILSFITVLGSFCFAALPTCALALVLSRYHRSLIDSRASEIQNSKMLALGEMAAGVAHEINNPLAVIQGWSGQIRDMINDDEVEFDILNEASLAIERNSQRIAKIVKSLQIFTRESSGDVLIATNLRDVADASMELLPEKMRNTDILLKLELSDQFALCSPSEILQVIVILLNNAVDALLDMPKGEREIIIGLEKNYLGRPLLYVEDNGPGITTEIQEKVFQPFFTTKIVGHGTGLGLSIAMGIMERHGGVFSLQSRPGKTRFVMEFPYYEPHSPHFAKGMTGIK